MKTQQGLTLTGLLAIVAFVTVLCVVAVPNLAATIKGNRELAQINTLLASLQLARRTAMQSGSDVSITPCPNEPTSSCTAESWSVGWTVRYVRPPPGAASLIRSYPALAGGNQLSGTAGSPIVFHPNGMTDLSTPATFTLCDPRGAREAHAVTVLTSGLTQASKTPGENVDGSALTCPA